MQLKKCSFILPTLTCLYISLNLVLTIWHVAITSRVSVCLSVQLNMSVCQLGFCVRYKNTSSLESCQIRYVKSRGFAHKIKNASSQKYDSLPTTRHITNFVPLFQITMCNAFIQNQINRVAIT